MELATTHKIIGDAMSQRTRLGMLTPSSNTTLEPVSAAMLADLPECSVHFGRFRVTEIALSDKALAQFDPSEILAAAELLSHARCDVIAWNGTSSGWLGFDTDERLCEAITGRTGAKACRSTLARSSAWAACACRSCWRRTGPGPRTATPSRSVRAPRPSHPPCGSSAPSTASDPSNQKEVSRDQGSNRR